MPNPLIASYAKKAGCSEAHVEALWKKAKDIAYERLKTDKGGQFYAYVNGIVRRELRLEGRTTFSEHGMLLELFAAQTHVKVVHDEDDLFATEYGSGDEMITFEAFHSGHEKNWWTLEFYSGPFRDERDDSDYELTNKGMSLPIFNFIISSVAKLIELHSPDEMFFNSRGEKRTRVYRKIFSEKYFPEYTVRETRRDDSSFFEMLRKK